MQACLAPRQAPSSGAIQPWQRPLPPHLLQHLSSACSSCTPPFPVPCAQPMIARRRTRTTVGASALGVAAILIWAAITGLLFLVAAYNDQLHTMRW